MMLHFHLSVKSGKKTHKQAIRETYGLIYQWAMVVVWVCVLLVFFCMPFCDVNWKMIGVYKPVRGKSIVLTYLLLVLRFCFLVNHQFYSIRKDERQYFFTVWFSFLSASSCHHQYHCQRLLFPFDRQLLVMKISSNQSHAMHLTMLLQK